MTEAKKTAAGVQTLERGLALLGHAAASPMTIEQLSTVTGFNMPATRRLVAGLVNQGFLEIGADRRVRGGARLIRLGVLAQSHREMVSVARPFLAELTESTGMSSFLGERSGDESVHLYRSPGRHRVAVSTPVGTRRPLAETSLGKALLLDSHAEWDRLFASRDPAEWLAPMLDAQRDGVALHLTPAPDNFHAIAAPVRDATNAIVAAVSVVTLPQYLETTSLEAIKAQVRRQALAISEALGAPPPV